MATKGAKYQAILATVDRHYLLGCIAANNSWSDKGIRFSPTTARKELDRRKEVAKATAELDHAINRTPEELAEQLAKAIFGNKGII